MALKLSEKAKSLKTQLATLSNQARTLYAELEAKGDAATGEERTKLNAMITEGEAKREELREIERLEALAEESSAGEGKSKPEDEGSLPSRVKKSWGQVVLGSDQLKIARVNPSEGKMQRVPVEGNLKALYSSTAATGGTLIEVDRQAGILDIARRRPFSILDLINTSSTSSDLVEYVVMDTRTNGAAVVPEYVSGNFGLKPGSDITFNKFNAAVKTIATWIAASTRILEDAPQLQELVDGELRYMIQFFLEQQILAGNGVGDNFTGMLNWAGIQTRVMHATTPVGRDQTTTDTKMSTIRKALTDIKLSFYEATGVIMSPADMESLELTEYNGNRYTNAFDPVAYRIWRVPVHESMAMPTGTALVGNFKLAATIWDRSATTVHVGQPNDYFLRNAVAILAELRAAFAVTRPLALEKVTLI